MIQNSGLGNAVSPLTSLTHVFRIPLLLICTHRGAPGVKDEPQHELMGRITGRIFDTMELSWESFPTAPDAIAPVLERAAGHMARGRRPYGLVMQKGTVAPDFEGLGLSACAATANKCLHGVPGVSFVVVSRAALSSHSDGPRRSLYLDLRSYCETQGRRSTPYIPSVQVFYARRETLAELAEGGWQARNSTSSASIATASAPSASNSCYLVRIAR